MRIFLAFLLCVGLVAGCGGGGPRQIPPTGTGQKVSGPILIQESPDYRPGSVATNVRAECTDLGTKLTDFAVSYGAEQGVPIQKAARVTKNTRGSALVVEFTQVFSGGNAFIGHRKAVSIHAELYSNGVLVDSRDLTRQSGGGFGAGFKGSCAVLGRTVKALGSDIAAWLQPYAM